MFPQLFSRISNKGAGLVEFGFLVSLIVLLAIGAVVGLGDEVKKQFTTTADSVASGAALERPVVQQEEAVPSEPLPPLPEFTLSFPTLVASTFDPQVVVANTEADDTVTLTVQYNADAPSQLAPVTLTANEQPIVVPMDPNAAGEITISALIERGPQSGNAAGVTENLLMFTIDTTSDYFVVDGDNEVVINESLSGDSVAIFTDADGPGPGQETSQGSVVLSSDAQAVNVPLGGAVSGTFYVRAEISRGGQLLDDDLEVSAQVLDEAFYNVSNTTNSNIGYGVETNFDDIFAITAGYQGGPSILSFDKFDGSLNWVLYLNNMGNFDYASMAAAQNQPYLAVSGLNGQISVINTTTGLLFRTYNSNPYQRGMAFSPVDENMLYAISRGRALEVMNMTTGSYISVNRVGNPAGVMAFNGSDLLASSLNDSRIYKIDTSSPSYIMTVSNASMPGIAIDLVFNEDDGNVYALTNNQYVCRMDADTLQQTEPCKPLPGGSSIQSGVDGPKQMHIRDGQIIISQNTGQGIRIYEWGVNLGAPLTEIEHITKVGPEYYSSPQFGRRIAVDDDGIYATHLAARPNGSTQTGGVWFLPQ